MLVIKALHINVLQELIQLDQRLLVQLAQLEMPVLKESALLMPVLLDSMLLLEPHNVQHAHLDINAQVHLELESLFARMENTQLECCKPVALVQLDILVLSRPLLLKYVLMDSILLPESVIVHYLRLTNTSLL